MSFRAFFEIVAIVVGYLTAIGVAFALAYSVMIGLVHLLDYLSDITDEEF